MKRVEDGTKDNDLEFWIWEGIYKLSPEQINFSPTNRNECPKVTEVFGGTK